MRQPWWLAPAISAVKGNSDQCAVHRSVYMHRARAECAHRTGMVQGGAAGAVQLDHRLLAASAAAAKSDCRMVLNLTACRRMADTALGLQLSAGSPLTQRVLHVQLHHTNPARQLSEASRDTHTGLDNTCMKGCETNDCKVASLQKQRRKGCHLANAGSKQSIKPPQTDGSND